MRSPALIVITTERSSSSSRSDAVQTVDADRLQTLFIDLSCERVHRRNASRLLVVASFRTQTDLRPAPLLQLLLLMLPAALPRFQHDGSGSDVDQVQMDISRHNQLALNG